MSADETRVNEILRAVRAARSRLEDESRPAFD